MKHLSLPLPIWYMEFWQIQVFFQILTKDVLDVLIILPGFSNSQQGCCERCAQTWMSIRTACVRQSNIFRKIISTSYTSQSVWKNTCICQNSPHQIPTKAKTQCLATLRLLSHITILLCNFSFCKLC